LLPRKVEKLLVLMIWMTFLDVAFEGLVLNQYGTFDHITKKTMDDPSYAYLYCELLNQVVRLSNGSKVQLFPNGNMMNNSHQYLFFLCAGNIEHTTRAFTFK